LDLSPSSGRGRVTTYVDGPFSKNYSLTPEEKFSFFRSKPEGRKKSIIRNVEEKFSLRIMDSATHHRQNPLNYVSLKSPNNV
jgi:hypothetical protein